MDHNLIHQVYLIPHTSDMWILTQFNHGDILIAQTHVALYLGNNEYTDCVGNPVRISTIGSTRYVFTQAARLISLDGVHFSPIDDVPTLPENPDGGNFDTEEVDLDEIAEGFVFDGMPPTVIREEVEVDVFRWIFDSISGFMDFLAGMIISIIKAPILGFVGMLEDFVDSMLTGFN